MKTKWVNNRLGAITTKIGSGATPLGGENAYKETGIYLIRSLNVHDWGFKEAKLACIDGVQAARLSNVVVEENDVLLNITGASVARCCLAPAEFLPARVNQHVSIIRPVNDTLLPSFLHYLLISKTYKDRLLQTGEEGGSTRQAITKAQIQEFVVEYPETIPEQQRIVDILDEAFAGIAVAKANAEKNLQNARALFESHLQAVFSQRGEGWVERSVGDSQLLEIIDGDRGVNYPKSSDFTDDGYCLFLNTKNVRPDGFDFESRMFVSPEKDRQLRKGKLKRGDVVLTTRGTIGNIGLYSGDVPFDNIRINSGMLILRPNEKLLHSSFLFELLRSEIVKDQIRKQTTGAAQPQLPIKTLVNFKIPVPSNLNKQLGLVEQLHRLEPETQRLESIYQQKLAALDELKRSLLHRAFSGEL